MFLDYILASCFFDLYEFMNFLSLALRVSVEVGVNRSFYYSEASERVGHELSELM